jgi:HEPN domain-containing protein
MPLEKAGLGSPAEWLVFARSDLTLARRGHEPGVLPEALCFHAQQAAEKSVKAVLLHCGVTFPPTHNLTTLSELLPPGCAPPPEVKSAVALSVYAVAGRYPLGRGEVVEEDHREAVELAGKALERAEGVVGKGKT